MTPQKVLTQYERGAMTAGGAILWLVLLATEHDPATFAGATPEDWLNELRKQTINIPKPEEFFILRSVCNDGPIDPEQWKADELAEKQQYVAGLEVWKAYFDGRV